VKFRLVRDGVDTLSRLERHHLLPCIDVVKSMNSCISSCLSWIRENVLEVSHQCS
jgi:hypothetical protein